MDGAAEGYRYRLDLGERFSIVARARLALSARGSGWPAARRSARLAHAELGYVLDCRVAEVHDDQTVTIEGTLRSVEAGMHTPLGSFRVPGPAGLPFSGVPWLAGWALALARARGDRVVVRKSLFGDILWARGGERLRRAMGGLAPEAILRWYGGLFPRTHRRAEQEDRLEFAPWRFGLPLGPLPVRVRYQYQPGGERVPFAGQLCPVYGVTMQLEVPARRLLGGSLRLLGEGRGTGRFLADIEHGKIARSERQADIKVEVAASRGAPFFVLELGLETDAWHEGRGPA